jgi:hypothetical protein
MAEVLTGEASTNNINCSKVVTADITHILVDWDLGPVLAKHSLTVGVDLHKPSGTHPRSLKAKIKTAHPRKQRADRQSCTVPHASDFTWGLGQKRAPGGGPDALCGHYRW